MNDEEFKAQLSALVDDELRRDEAMFLVRRLSREPEAVDQVGRYFMISDAIRRQLPEVMDSRLAERVNAALQSEPAYQAGPGGATRRLLRPIAGLGVAASVAMVAVSYWTGQAPVPGEETPGFVAASSQPLQSSSFLPQPQNQWNRLDPDVQRRLQGYLVNHSEHVSTGQLGGVLSYVRIAGQQESRD
jgi:sigma-E factor negative regulatory protein RseA